MYVCMFTLDRRGGFGWGKGRGGEGLKGGHFVIRVVLTVSVRAHGIRMSPYSLFPFAYFVLSVGLDHLFFFACSATPFAVLFS